MENKVKIVLVLLLLYTVSSGTATKSILGFSLGKCPHQKVMSNFDPFRYLGKWYEIMKYDNIFELGGKCITAEYTDNANGAIGVKNCQIQELTGKPRCINGEATFDDDSGDAKLSITFPSVGNVGGKYWVLDTDYTGYAIVYSCSDLLVARNENLWILTREKKPELLYIKKIIAKLLKRKLNVLSLKKTKQDCHN